ncbi:MAG: PAS domain-containing protein, partial [Bacteroidetes bacterium]|nr:PAS domain-containing protein [Bacteroidota bacterium]
MKNLYANHFSETPGEYLRSYVNKEWRFLDALSEGIIVQNRFGEIILTNIAAQKILSINPQEIVGQTVFTGQLITIHEDGSFFTKETYPSSITLQTGKPQRGVIMGLQKKDDSICWIKVNAEPVLNKEESVVEAVVTSFTDITESVLANEKLKISERKLQTVLSSIKTGIFLIDTDYRLLLANAKGKKLLGITEDTLNENQHPYFIDLLPRNQYREKAIESFERMASGERVEYESKYVTNDGKDLWLLVSCTGVKNETGVTTSFCIAATNITHQKKAEQRLAKSESRWKFALEGSGEGVWEYNFQTKESYYSPLYKKMLGFDEDEFKDEANEWLDKIFPNDLEKVDKIDRLYEEDLIDHHEVEYRIQNKSGEYVWILDRGMIVEKTTTGAPLILVGTIKNINERKKTEDALKCSEKQFRSFMENTPTITWIVDENAHIKYLNPGYMKAFNLTEEVFGKSIYKIFPAGICNEYIANNNRVWETNQPLETIEEGIKPDGSKVVLQIFKFPLGTDTNGVRLLGGTALDITQLIKTQAELRISNDRYSYAGKASSDAIWDWDLTENR